MTSILDAVFRSNPNYELVLFDRLTDEQQRTFDGLEKDHDFYGILRPRGGFSMPIMPIKSVCRETALLFLTLQAPGKLPSYARVGLGAQCTRVIVEFVLDGVLEVESNGAFVCRSEAYALIYGSKPPHVAEGTIGRLSRDALMYAQGLEISNISELSARLYFFNRLPVSPYWVRRFPSHMAVTEYLGLKNGIMRRFASSWSPFASAAPSNGWISWRSHSKSRLPGPNSSYKLYVSPHSNFVREAFQATIAALLDSQAHQLKVGSDVYGLLRPDKIVSYFWTLDALKEAAALLTGGLHGCPAHGVPFTAQLTDDGLLSWGMDPPADQHIFVFQQRESWRLWVTNRLATALLAAKRIRKKGPEPWHFALERLRLDHVDTETWTPKETIWQDGPLSPSLADG